MEIYIECECGKPLQITNVEPASTYVSFTVQRCKDCEKENYEAGETDAKQERF